MRLAIFLTLLGVIGFAFVPRARACGGLACNTMVGQPVAQTAERILFVQNGDGTVTSVVEILYEGEGDRFAWILPVPGRPEVGISSAVVFDRLQAGTTPTYTLTTTTEGNCSVPSSGGGIGCGASAADSPSFATDAGTIGFSDAGMSPVEVIDSGSVGPYDYVTISLDPSLPDAGMVATDWLEANGYNVTPLAGERLGPYLSAGMNLIAFRLTKSTLAGSIRPIVLTYTGTRPMIPIRPTAMAAADDMGVMVWVLGPHRSIPTNYRHLVLDEARINWFSPGTTYDALVTQAADEAGGQGFVTEDARRSDELPLVHFGNETTESLEGLGDYAAVELATRRFGTFDGFADVFAAQVVLPEGVSVGQAIGCFSCVVSTLDEGFDRASFEEALEREVVEPVLATQRLLRTQPIATRFYTTMSPDEMTVDPEFDFNPDLPLFSNVHTAQRVIECRGDTTFFEARWRTTLQDGRVIRGENATPGWPVPTSLPAARRVEQLGTSGEATMVVDRGPEIDDAIEENNRLYPRRKGGGACAAGTEGRGSAGLALLAFVGFALRRRRFVVD
jgi:MYXO-CTERM domain-containing protein